jgi:hypothetical protein
MLWGCGNTKFETPHITLCIILWGCGNTKFETPHITVCIILWGCGNTKFETSLPDQYICTHVNVQFGMKTVVKPAKPSTLYRTV